MYQIFPIFPLCPVTWGCNVASIAVCNKPNLTRSWPPWPPSGLGPESRWPRRSIGLNLWKPHRPVWRLEWWEQWCSPPLGWGPPPLWVAWPPSRPCLHLEQEIGGKLYHTLFTEQECSGEKSWKEWGLLGSFHGNLALCSSLRYCRRVYGHRDWLTEPVSTDRHQGLTSHP